jgi:hypothetical protein
MTQHEKLRQAESQVDAEIGFYIHLTVYVLVIAILIGVDYTDDVGWWVQWPALGWGIGILGHAFGVFGRLPRSIAEWRLRKIHHLSTDKAAKPADRRVGT